MVGTGTPDLEATVALTRRAFDLGFAAALVLPPYCYKPVEEEGLFAWFAELVRTTASPIAIYLYNFPQLTGIEFSPALSARHLQGFPKRILGAKNSSGNLPMRGSLPRSPASASSRAARRRLPMPVAMAMRAASR